jgi:hypothetical protein
MLYIIVLVIAAAIYYSVSLKTRLMLLLIPIAFCVYGIWWLGFAGEGYSILKDAAINIFSTFVY